MEFRQLQAQADRCFFEEEYDRAIELYERCIAQQPDRLDAYWYLGLIFLIRGEEERCQEVWFSAMWSSDGVEGDVGELLEILKVEGDRFLQLHQFEVAERIYLKILEIDAESPQAYYALGRAIAQQGRFDEAIEYWQTTTQLDADFIEAYRRQGIVWQKLEQFEEAISCYRYFLEREADPQVCYNLGLCLLKSQRLEDAIAYFEKAIELDANFADAYSDLGYVWLKKSDRYAAISDFRQAILLNAEFVLDLLRGLETQSNRHRFLASLIEETDFEIVNRNLERLILEFSHTQDDRIDEVERVDLIPTGFYESSLEWSKFIELDSLEPTYLSNLPESIVNLKPPKANEESVHFSFRFPTKIFLPSSFVVMIPEGRYWINEAQTQSATIAADNRFIADISPDFPILSPNHPDKHPSQHSILSNEGLEPVREIQGTVAVLSGLLNNVYFHWMFDVLPRIELLRRSPINLNDIDFYLTSFQLPFQKETLKIIDIPEDKRLPIEECSHIRSPKLIVPSFPGSISWMPQWTCDFLKKHFLDESAIDSSNLPNRIYISRKKSKIRRVLNEEKIIELLRKFGFVSVTLEGMSVREQAAMFANADAIVAPHGSGLTNLAFCRSTTKVIELFSPNYVYHCYWFISNLVGVEYYYLLGETIPGFYLNKLIYPGEQSEDIWMNLNRLRETIAFAGIDSIDYIVG